jgi:hypothetical protein
MTDKEIVERKPLFKQGDILYEISDGSKIEIIDIVADQYKFKCGDEYPHYEFFGYIESNYTKEPQVKESAEIERDKEMCKENGDSLTQERGNVDRQAEEEEEIESDFVMGIIESEHRQPTFDDAIKYGMRLQKERLLAKVVDGEDSLTLDGVITFDYYDGDKAYGCVAHDSFCLEDWGLKDMDKVKILILKKVMSYD